MALSDLWRSPKNFSGSTLPPVFAGMAQRVVFEPDHQSARCSWGGKDYANLSSYSVWAAAALAGAADDLGICLVRTNAECFSGEQRLPDGSVLVATATSSGNLRGAIMSPTGAWSQIPTMGTEAAKDLNLGVIHGLYLLLATETKMVSDSDPVKGRLAKAIKDLQRDHIPGTDRYSLDEDTLRYISEALYHGAKKNILQGNITGGNINILPKSSVSALQGEVICGTPSLLGAATASGSKKKTMTMADAMAMPEFATYRQSKTWTADEEQLIPKFDEDYPVLPEAIKLAHRFVASRKSRRPMSNFLWRGMTSYGKSTGVEQIAALLHTPLMRITCSSNMEAQEFLSSFVPDNGAGTEGLAGLPSFQEISLMPDEAWEKMTGEYDADITSEECFKEYTRRVAAGGSGERSARFKLVESPYVVGLRSGYIVEVQEMSRIKDAGTMVTLNEYDRAGALIPLVDGSFSRRHEDAMVIYTDNIGYSSCRPVDPSVLRRMDCILTSNRLEDSQVKARIVYNTGFSDIRLLDGMLAVWKEVIQYCRDQEIRSGEISPNELERWVALVQMDGTGVMEDAAMEAMVSKVSPDEDTQIEILRSALRPALAKHKLS